jgi:PAS domain S-box-containing protein
MRTDETLTSALLETLEAYVIITDPDGRIRSIDHSIEETFGYAESEVRGRPVGEVFRPEDEINEVRRWFDELTAGDLPPEQFPSGYEQAWIGKDGTRRWAAWSNTVITNEDGQVASVLGTEIDVTKRRRSAERTQDQRETRVRLNGNGPYGGHPPLPDRPGGTSQCRAARGSVLRDRNTAIH